MGRKWGLSLGSQGSHMYFLSQDPQRAQQMSVPALSFLPRSPSLTLHFTPSSPPVGSSPTSPIAPSPC